MMATAPHERREGGADIRALWEVASELLDLEGDLWDELLEGESRTSEEEADARFRRWFDRENKNLEEGADHVMALVKEREARAAIRKAEAKRLTARAKVDENSAKWFKAKLTDILRAVKAKRIETKRFKISRCSSRAPVEVACNVEDLPEKYQRVKTEVSADKDALREALEAGEKIEGVTLGEGSEYLRVS